MVDMKLLRGIFYGLLFELVALIVVWGAIHVQGTRWAVPFAAMVALPILAFVFPEKRQ